LTVKVWPATVTVPLRLVPAVLACTLNVAVALPLPLPLVTVIHEALLVEDHPQPVGEVTFTDVEPAVATTDVELALSVKVQAAAAWLIVKVCPATVTVPDRVVPAVFGCTLTLAVPLPLPLPLVTVIHAALLVEDHPQPVPEVTSTEAEPPAATTEAELALSV